MIENTATYIKNKHYNKAAILATTGTIKANLYQNALQKNNINYTLPNQKNIMEIIYNYIKQGQRSSYKTMGRNHPKLKLRLLYTRLH